MIQSIEQSKMLTVCGQRDNCCLLMSWKLVYCITFS